LVAPDVSVFPVFVVPGEPAVLRAGELVLQRAHQHSRWLTADG
jgi:hypothetical protein